MRGYSITDLLIDQYYSPVSSSRRFNGGIINYAVKREDTYPPEGWADYAIRYKPERGIKDQWATVAVNVS